MMIPTTSLTWLLCVQLPRSSQQLGTQCLVNTDCKAIAIPCAHCVACQVYLRPASGEVLRVPMCKAWPFYLPGLKTATSAMHACVQDPASGEKMDKSVFVVFYAGERARFKISKVGAGLCWGLLPVQSPAH